MSMLGRQTENFQKRTCLTLGWVGLRSTHILLAIAIDGYEVTAWTAERLNSACANPIRRAPAFQAL